MMILLMQSRAKAAWHRSWSTAGTKRKEIGRMSSVESHCTVFGRRLMQLQS